MDRFIAAGSGITYAIITDLKSNMDRFIGEEFILLNKIFQGFKIQYG